MDSKVRSLFVSKNLRLDREHIVPKIADFTIAGESQLIPSSAPVIHGIGQRIDQKSQKLIDFLHLVSAVHSIQLLSVSARDRGALFLIKKPA